MNASILDLYVDYLISSFGPTTATTIRSTFEELRRLKSPIFSA